MKAAPTEPKKPDSGSTASFWEHLDALRAALLKSVAAVVLFGAAAFCFRERLFAIVLAPRDADFITYRLLHMLTDPLSGTPMPDFHVQLINTALTGQFVIHMKTALCTGLLCASPYVVYQLFRFVSPALYADERRYAVRVAGSGYLLFLLGVLVSYFLIFPLTFRFLGTYEVSPEVTNAITLHSYISTLATLSLALGIVFEIPVLAWFFARLGLLSADFMCRHRKHAVVLILVVGAIITPTSDIFTLLLISLPMWLLYEASIHIVRRTQRRRADRPA